MLLWKMLSFCRFYIARTQRLRIFGKGQPQTDKIEKFNYAYFVVECKVYCLSIISFTYTQSRNCGTLNCLISTTDDSSKHTHFLAFQTWIIPFSFNTNNPIIGAKHSPLRHNCKQYRLSVQVVWPLSVGQVLNGLGSAVWPFLWLI